nr:hypothetical protein [Tanacetum cinerariifolium]
MQEKHLDNIKKYQSLKRKPISVAQARKNMIVYLKNMVGNKIAHFKGMTYDQESFKKLRAETEVSGSHSTQDTPAADPTEIVGGIKQAHRIFEDMVKDFDREDMDALWRLTNEKFSTAMPTEDKEKALWVELKRLERLSIDRCCLLLMLNTKLQVDEECEIARDLVMKIFREANKPKSRKSLDISSK